MSTLLKQQIEQTYITARHFDEDSASFASKMLELMGEDEQKEPRSKLQNRSRWLYFSMVSNELNDRGETFQMPGLNIPSRYNKEIIYEIFWKSIRDVLYPEKRRQLNTKEFCNVVDHILDLFALRFDIHIAYPNYKDFIHQQEAKNQ